MVTFNTIKKGKRKVQGVPQSQTAALPRYQEEETQPNKRKSNKISSLTKISHPVVFPKNNTSSLCLFLPGKKK